MQQYCARVGAELAPHCKTHMSGELWQLQRAHGAASATVATVVQAVAMSAFGATDIIIANQVVSKGEIAVLNTLRERGVEVTTFVDSLDALKALSQHLDPAAQPLPVLIELGAPGMRTGCRSLKEFDQVMHAVTATPRLCLAGMSGYEGVFGTASHESRSAATAYLHTARSAIETLLSHFSPTGAQVPLVSFGGSDLFDRVIDEFKAEVESGSIRLVLRSGCYLLHDHGKYARAQLAMAANHALAPQFLPALEVWGVVLSVPESDLAVVGVGRRNVGTDADLPQPLVAYRDEDLVDTQNCQVEQIYDQHTVLKTPPGRLRVGDKVAFGISHPCTTLDKWNHGVLVDQDDLIAGCIGTRFG